VPRHSALAAGEVTDAGSFDLISDRFYCGKERILAHRVCADPDIVPSSDVGIISIKNSSFLDIYFLETQKIPKGRNCLVAHVACTELIDSRLDSSYRVNRCASPASEREMVSLLPFLLI